MPALYFEFAIYSYRLRADKTVVLRGVRILNRTGVPIYIPAVHMLALRTLSIRLLRILLV